MRRDGLAGGLLAYDGQLIDDARLVTAVARTAAQHGATILTRVAASNATGTSVTLTDQRSGESFEVSARAVINASGVWAGEVDPSIRLRPSRGTHLVFDAAAFGNPAAALTIPIPGEINRFVFAMPEQLGRVYLGLTDEDAPGPIPDVPQPTAEETSFLLDTVNTALDVALSTDDVIGAYAGLRPLIDAGEGRTADVSREHRGGRVTVRRAQCHRRQADRIPLHGRRCARPGRRVARADRRRVAVPETCRWSAHRRIPLRRCVRRSSCRPRWWRATARRRRT